MAYIAMYSPRPGAVSSKWEDSVDMEIKKHRFRELSDDLQKYSLEINRGFIGRTMTVLVESPDRKNGYLSAKTQGRLIVRFEGDSSLIGNFTEVKIISASPLSMEAELVSSGNDNE